MIVRIDHSAAMQYIHDNFDISGEAARMCASVFQFVDLNPNLDRPEQVLLDLLDGIGFERRDLDAMKAKEVIQ